MSNNTKKRRSNKLNEAIQEFKMRTKNLTALDLNNLDKAIERVRSCMEKYAKNRTKAEVDVLYDVVDYPIADQIKMANELLKK